MPILAGVGPTLTCESLNSLIARPLAIPLAPSFKRGRRENKSAARDANKLNHRRCRLSSNAARERLLEVSRGCGGGFSVGFDRRQVVMCNVKSLIDSDGRLDRDDARFGHDLVAARFWRRQPIRFCRSTEQHHAAFVRNRMRCCNLDRRIHRLSSYPSLTMRSGNFRKG